jgi:hypothetical protein
MKTLVFTSTFGDLKHNLLVSSIVHSDTDFNPDLLLIYTPGLVSIFLDSDLERGQEFASELYQNML